MCSSIVAIGSPPVPQGKFFLRIVHNILNSFELNILTSEYTPTVEILSGSFIPEESSL